MDATCQIDRDGKREIIGRSLNKIANDISMMMRDVGLIPVFLTVRDSGDAVATIAAPVDPSDDDWSRAMAIVCRIIEKKLGEGANLRHRQLLCAVANAEPMSATDVTPN